MEDRDDGKHDCEQRSDKPRDHGPGKITKRQGQQRAGNKDNSPRVPILSTDLVEKFASAPQPRDLLVELLETSHACRT